MSVTNKAIWYIESHLRSDLSLEAIAQSVGVSRFHLSRAFAVSTGVSLGAYCRGRRLSEAARAIESGAPDLLTVALDAGYGSHEAFTRAFRQQFGLNPEQLRHGQAQIKLQAPFGMNQSTVCSLAAPQVRSHEGILIFGLGQQCPAAGHPSIMHQWESFVPHIGHIEGQVGNVAYGVICHSDDSGGYDYICGVEVRSFPSDPAEFSRRLRLHGKRSGIRGFQNTVIARPTGRHWSGMTNGSTDARVREWSRFGCRWLVESVTASPCSARGW